MRSAILDCIGRDWFCTLPLRSYLVCIGGNSIIPLGTRLFAVTWYVYVLMVCILYPGFCAVHVGGYICSTPYKAIVLPCCIHIIAFSLSLNRYLYMYTYTYIMCSILCGWHSLGLWPSRLFPLSLKSALYTWESAWMALLKYVWQSFTIHISYIRVRVLVSLEYLNKHTHTHVYTCVLNKAKSSSPSSLPYYPPLQSLPYLVSNTLVSLPYLMVLALVFVAILYPMASLNPSVPHFFVHVTFTFLALLVAEGMTMAVAGWVPNFMAGMYIEMFIQWSKSWEVK